MTPAKPQSLVGKVLDVEWSDAFDDLDTHPDELGAEYIWHTYGRCLRDTPELLTVATSEGGAGKDRQVNATTVLRCMVIDIQVLS